MPLVEGVGVVDTSTNEVLVCVSRGPVAHGKIQAGLKRAFGSRVHWENALCVAAPIHIVAVTSVAEDHDWETYVLPVLERCSDVVKAACGPTSLMRGG